MSIAPPRLRLQQSLLATGGILLPVAVVAALVGLVTASSTGQVRILFWTMLTAIAAIFVAWASTEAAHRAAGWARFSAAAGGTAVAAALVVISASAIQLLRPASDSPCTDPALRDRLMSFAHDISVPVSARRSVPTLDCENSNDVLLGGVGLTPTTRAPLGPEALGRALAAIRAETVDNLARSGWQHATTGSPYIRTAYRRTEDGHTYWLTVMRSSRVVWVTINEGDSPW